MPSTSVNRILVSFTSGLFLLASACATATNGNGDGGAGGADGDGGGGAGGSTVGSIVGDFIELYSCRMQDNNACAGTDVRTTIQIAGPNSGLYNFVDTTLDVNWAGSGTLEGDTLTWSATDPDFPSFSETGTWKFAPDGNSFTKESEFVQAGSGRIGECTGSATRVPIEPPPPPPFDPDTGCTNEPM